MVAIMENHHDYHDHDQDRKPLGAEQQLRQVRGVVDADPGQDAGGAEEQRCRVDAKQNHSQVSQNVLVCCWSI